MSVETDLLASAVIVVCQSLVYGVFVVLMPMSTALLIKRGLGNRANQIMLAIIWTMFALSTAHWAISLAFLIAKVKAQTIVDGPIRVQSDNMNAIVTINFGIADGVVVWRVWVLCKEEYRKALACSFALLGLTSVSIFTTIALRGAISALDFTRDSGDGNSPIVQALNVVQIVAIGMSLLTNVSSTVIVGFYVWKYRRFLRQRMRHQTTRAERILVLLFESGLLYALYVIFSIICSRIRVSIGAIGDVTNSVLAHISGVYPTIIIILVSIQGTVHSSTFSVGKAQNGSHTAVNVYNEDVSMRFERNPGMLSNTYETQDLQWPTRRPSMLSSIALSDLQDGPTSAELVRRGWDGPWFDKNMLSGIGK